SRFANTPNECFCPGGKTTTLQQLPLKDHTDFRIPPSRENGIDRRTGRVGHNIEGAIQDGLHHDKQLAPGQGLPWTNMNTGTVEQVLRWISIQPESVRLREHALVPVSRSPQQGQPLALF